MMNKLWILLNCLPSFLLLLASSLSAAEKNKLSENSKIVPGENKSTSCFHNETADRHSSTFQALSSRHSVGDNVTIVHQQPWHLITQTISNEDRNIPLSHHQVPSRTRARLKSGKTKRFQKRALPDSTNTTEVSSSAFSNSNQSMVVRAVLFLPQNRSYLFSVEHTLPAVESALGHVRRHTLPRVSIEVIYKDSGCNSRDSPVFLFNLVNAKAVDVVLGPVCDYALAPVARYAPFWKLPVITVGGPAFDFGEKVVEYSTLTRMGQHFEDLFEFIEELLTRFWWNSLHLIYDAVGQNDISDGFCFLLASTFIKKSKEKNMTHVFHMYEKKSLEEILVENIGLKYGGKFNSTVVEF